MTVAVDAGEVAGREGIVAGRGLPGVAEEGASAHGQFAVFDEQFGVAERTTNAVGVVAGAVDRQHRAAFGQAVALVGGNAEGARTGQQFRGDAGAADGNELQRGRRLAARETEVSRPGLEQFGHQDDAAGAGFPDLAVERCRVETLPAGPAEFGQRRQIHRHAAQQRRIDAGDVFQQQGQR